MSARRWSVLLVFVLVNLVLSLGWFVWAAIAAPPGNRMAAMGISGILQLLELPLAYYLLQFSDYAHTWTIRLNVVKIVTAAGLTIGVLATGNRDPYLIAGGAAICGFYVGYTLFLRANAEFFD